MSSAEGASALVSGGLMQCRTCRLSSTALAFTISEESMNSSGLKDGDVVIAEMKRISDGRKTEPFETVGRTSHPYTSSKSKMSFRIPPEICRGKEMEPGQFFYARIRVLDVLSWFDSDEEVPLYGGPGPRPHGPGPREDIPAEAGGIRDVPPAAAPVPEPAAEASRDAEASQEEAPRKRRGRPPKPKVGKEVLDGPPDQKYIFKEIMGRKVGIPNPNYRPPEDEDDGPDPDEEAGE